MRGGTFGRLRRFCGGGYAVNDRNALSRSAGQGAIAPHNAMKSGVSFVVPVFNKAAFLIETLRSIASQRGDFEREFIFVDDGSSDDSMAIIQAQTKGWQNVTIVSQENRGSAGATNRGLALASRVYVKFVDADDLLSPFATEALLRALDKTDAVLAHGDLIAFQPDKRPAIDIKPPPYRTSVNTAPLKSVLRTSYFNPTQIMVRTKEAQAVGGCDERVVHSQEYGLALRLARIGTFCHVHATFAWQPVGAPCQLSSQPARQLKRVTLTSAYFLRDFPETPVSLQRYAHRRAAGRAWKWARRQHNVGFGSRWFWRFALSRLAVVHDYAREIERCATVFDDSGLGRRAPGS